MADHIIGSLLDAIPQPVLLLDDDGLVGIANGPAQELLGRWIVGRSYVTALRQPALLARIDAAYAEGQRLEARFTQSDQAGETLFRVTITPITAGGSSLNGVILHFADVTHLTEVAEMRRDFVANVSHELKTPLTSVLGFIETLRGPARDDAETRERFLGIMEVEARRMNRMVQDLLSLSRVEGQERMRPSDRVDLGSVIRGAVSTLRPVAEASGNTLEVEIPERLQRVPGDADQLTQVFLNLIENALKYGGAGRPVSIEVAEGEGAGGLRGQWICASVQDRGEGIDALHLPRLTERFYRVDNHRSRSMGGTGLGLAIVKHIVNRHRGRLKIASEPGQGSRFSVYLPRQAEVQSPSDAA